MLCASAHSSARPATAGAHDLLPQISAEVIRERYELLNKPQFTQPAFYLKLDLVMRARRAIGGNYQSAT